MVTDQDYFDETNRVIESKDIDIAALKEQVAQLRIEADFNFEQYQDAGRLMFERQAVTEQQAEAIRLKDEALSLIVERFIGWHTAAKEALVIQPSPEILQDRDERVAEACAKTYEQAFYMNKAEAIRSGEWRKYL